MSSLITLTDSNNILLNKFLDGIASGTSVPREVIVIDLSGDAEIHKAYNFMVKVQHYNGLNSDYKGGLINLFLMTTALNLGARKAWDDNLIFLDVNCIPGKKFIEKMEEHLLCASGLIMGEPRVLKLPMSDNMSESELFANSLYDSLRPDLKKELTLCFDPNLFRSQAFGISKKDFEELGGFDENYKDGNSLSCLDFVHKLSHQKKDFYLSKNTFYHSCGTPQNKSETDLQGIVDQSNYFFKKWSVWPCKNKLAKLDEQGLIAWKENQTLEIEILKNAHSNQITKKRRKEAVVNS